MPLFKSRARPRLTRLSTSSSLFRRKERQIYIYLFAAAILLIASVSILQLSLGRTSAHAARGNFLNACLKLVKLIALLVEPTFQKLRLLPPTSSSTNVCLCLALHAHVTQRNFLRKTVCLVSGV